MVMPMVNLRPRCMNLSLRAPNTLEPAYIDAPHYETHHDLVIDLMQASSVRLSNPSPSHALVLSHWHTEHTTSAGIHSAGQAIMPS